MKVITTTQKNTPFKRTQLDTIDLINQNLIQADGILAFMVNHLETNKGFNFDVDIIRDTFYNVETLISDSYKAILHNFKTTQSLNLVHNIEQQLAKARGTMAFLIHHLEENNGFTLDQVIVSSVLWNIETLIKSSQASLDKLINYNGGIDD